MIELDRAGASFWSGHARRKLLVRNELPGAHAFDRAANALKDAAARGLSTPELLPLAFASSWFVNNAAPSPVLRKWLSPPFVEVWSELVATLDEGVQAWLDRGEAEKSTIQSAVSALAVSGQGAGAVSKVLALLVPDVVPLMPDAAVWFALGTTARPEAPDAQTATIASFSPMLTWFANAAARNAAELESLAADHERETGVALSGAQALDRLLWFESVGHRHFRPKDGPGWWWVKNGDRQAVVPVALPYTGTPAGEGAIDLAAEEIDPAWRESARAALDEVAAR